MSARAISNTSLGGYATKGGNLVQIGAGIEEAKGNKHNETKIDGVSGIQLYEQGQAEPTAEIEDKEILVDGNRVISQRLKFNGKQSYADKMRQIVKERNKKEAEQLETKSIRKKNSLERQLAGLTMAEDTLFQLQETHKQLEGTKVLQDLGTKKFALGGKITNKATLVTSGQYKGMYRLPNGTYTNIKPLDGEPLPVANFGKWDALKNTSETTAPSPIVPSTIAAGVTGGPEVVTASASSSAASLVPGVGSVIQASNTAAGVIPTDELSGFNKFTKSSTGQAVIGAIPGLISGVAGLIQAGKTPKLPTPLLNRAEPVETRINVNPQLANIRGTIKASVDNIMNNTSSSNNAKHNITSARLRGAAEENSILSAKENQEMALRNANSQNKQMTNAMNNATMNQHSMNQYQRTNDIRTMKNASLSHLTGTLQNAITHKRVADNFNSYQKANLADDKLGTKLDIYMNDRDAMSDPAIRQMVIEKANEMNPDGTPKYAFNRKQAIKLGLISE